MYFFPKAWMMGLRIYGSHLDLPAESQSLPSTIGVSGRTLESWQSCPTHAEHLLCSCLSKGTSVLIFTATSPLSPGGRSVEHF